jgi:cell division protein FtsQ
MNLNVDVADLIPAIPDWLLRPRLPDGTLPTVAIVLVLIGLIALIPEDAPLTQLEVRGEFTHLSVEDVRAAAAPFLSTSFFAADVNAMRDAVAGLPWVARVRAERRWPGAIAVRIEERVPFARWNQGALLDVESHAFAPRAGEAPTGLPRLGGSPGHELEVAQAWRRIAPALDGSPLQLLGLRLDARGEWSAETASGIELRFGQNAPDERLPMLTGAVQKTINGGWDRVRIIDLRYTNGFAVGWREAEGSGEGT